MKKQKFLLGAAGLLALGLTACSNEMPVDNGMVSDRDQVRFLRVAIANPPSTRAEFENGTKDENEVDDLVFKFYDATGAPLTTENSIEDVYFNDNTGTPTPSVGKVKEVIVQIKIARNAQFPAYAMCFINPVNGVGESDLNKPLAELRDLKRSAIFDNNGHFAMTNSVYYGEDIISGAANVKISGTPIPAANLYTTKDAAKAEDAEAVDVYVERYAAKVKFTAITTDFAGNKGIQTYTTENGYNLKFVPEAWSINADETETYAVKRFENTNVTNQNAPTYAQVEAMLGNWKTWNDAELHRSYWACSPTFYAKDFPQVSDNIIDNVTTGTGAGVVVAPYSSVYYSFNQIKDNGVIFFNNGGENWTYVMENTMGADAFKSLNPKACAPSVLMVGHYDVTTAVGTTPLDDANGFCLYKQNLYFKNVVPPGANENQLSILDALLNENSTLATNQNGTAMVNANSRANIKNMFEVVHPNKYVRGTQAVPHRYVTLQLKETLTEAQLEADPLWYKPMGSATWVRVELTKDAEGNPTQTMAELINSVNTLLWADLGNASAYTENKAYFSIPIQHLGMTENTLNTPYTDGILDWGKVRVGDFGLVRNHVYDLQVDAITGLASGIEDLDNPLVPSMDDNNYWVKYRINILNWRVVPTQGGIVLP